MQLNFKDLPKFCISLKRSTDRRDLVKKEFDKAGLYVEFFDAVDRNDLILPELSDKENKSAIIPQGTGILACMLSHLELMKYARAQKMEAIVVWEDDVLLCEDFNERIKYIENLPGFDFDILSIGGHFPNGKAMEGAAHNTQWNHIYQITQLNGTYGYIITAKCMDFCIRNLHYNWGIDQFFGEVLYRRFASFAFIPFLVGARPCKSEIVGVFSKHEDYYYQQEAITDLNVPYVNVAETEQEKRNRMADTYRTNLLAQERS